MLKSKKLIDPLADLRTAALEALDRLEAAQGNDDQQAVINAQSDVARTEHKFYAALYEQASADIRPALVHLGALCRLAGKGTQPSEPWHLAAIHDTLRRVDIRDRDTQAEAEKIYAQEVGR